MMMMMVMVMIVRVIAYGLGIMHSCPALHLPSTLHSYDSCDQWYSLHFYNATNDLLHNYNTTFYNLTLQPINIILVIMFISNDLFLISNQRRSGYDQNDETYLNM